MMKIVSTNIGEPKTLNHRGKKVVTGIFKSSVNEGIFLGNQDVKNDYVIDRGHHGGVDKACYLYSEDHYEYWQQLYPDLEMPWGMFGENITVKGLNETQINIGDVFKIGNAIIQATQPRQPCFKLKYRFNNKSIVNQFVEAGFPGVYVRVLKEGLVKKGDLMEIVDKKTSLSVKKVFELLNCKGFQKESVELAVNDPFLAASCRKDLLKRWGDKINKENT